MQLLEQTAQPMGMRIVARQKNVETQRHARVQWDTMTQILITPVVRAPVAFTKAPQELMRVFR